MKKLLTFILTFLPALLFAQKFETSGYVFDKGNTPLQGVSVMENGTQNGTTTDAAGYFVLQVSSSDAIVSFSYIGYETKSLNAVTLNNLHNIVLEPTDVLLQNVVITAQTAKERETPVAVNTIYAEQIEIQLGTKDFPEILKTTPGVHVNNQGGGWGDSEIWMRGFDNANIAVLINGVPRNDMENGSFYWSDWTCLSDVASSIQTQRGIGASKVSTPSVGGTINIVTKSNELKQGGSAYYMLGNDGYSKVLLSLNSGLSKNGWSMSVLGSKTTGDGYVQGTEFEAYCYFVNIAKRLNTNHQLSFTAFGSPSKHYERSNALTKSEWQNVKSKYATEYDWRRFNPDYGFYNGVRKTNDFNTYHKPQISLNHIWQINSKSNLSTSVYATWGRGNGYTGQANSTTYTEDDLYGANYGLLNMAFRNSDGTFDYAKIYEINAASSNGSELILTKQIGNQDWYGLLSTYSTEIGDKFNLYCGIDFRSCKAEHSNEIADLFGGDYYIDYCRTDVSSKDNVNALNESWVNEKLDVGDKVKRDYDSHIIQEGFFAQMDYHSDKIYAFVGGSVNFNSYWRYDRLYYDNANARSETKNLTGGTIKAGINYNLNSSNRVYFNTGFISSVPQFKAGVFMSANTSHAINEDAKNQKAFSTEIGYGFKNDYISVNFGGYYIEWIDKTMTKKGKLTNKEKYYMNMTGVNSQHFGLEFDLKARPFRWAEFTAMLSLGDWKWNNDKVKGLAYSTDGQAITPDGEITSAGSDNQAWAVIDMKNIHVGGSAQTTAALDADFKITDKISFGSCYNFYGRNYAYYSLSGGNLSLGKEMVASEPYKIPSSHFADFRLTYKFSVGKINASLIGLVNNAFDAHYIEKAWNPSNIAAEITEVDSEEVYMFYSIGRTWSCKLKIEF